MTQRERLKDSLVYHFGKNCSNPPALPSSLSCSTFSLFSSTLLKENEEWSRTTNIQTYFHLNEGQGFCVLPHKKWLSLLSPQNNLKTPWGWRFVAFSRSVAKKIFSLSLPGKQTWNIVDYTGTIKCLIQSVPPTNNTYSWLESRTFWVMA